MNLAKSTETPIITSTTSTTPEAVNISIPVTTITEQNPRLGLIVYASIFTWIVKFVTKTRFLGLFVFGSMLTWILKLVEKPEPKNACKLTGNWKLETQKLFEIVLKIWRNDTTNNTDCSKNYMLFYNQKRIWLQCEWLRKHPMDQSASNILQLSKGKEGNA